MKNQEKLSRIISLMNEAFPHLSDSTKLAITAMLSEGHLLIEDIPGVGKTSFIKYLSKLFGIELSRVQFTNDLLPSDILGSQIYDKEKGDFRFLKGPIFGELILADELNRATPKTQSALLQAMEEKIVNIDGLSIELPKPFIVLATQNPSEQIGTFPLPESQQDRFFMSLTLSLPPRSIEKQMLKGIDLNKLVETSEAIFSGKEIIEASKEIESIHVSDEMFEYILDLIEAGRSSDSASNQSTLSLRSSRDLTQAAKAYAYIMGRDFVIPDDIQAIAEGVLGHRIGGSRGVKTGKKIVKELIASIKVR